MKVRQFKQLAGLSFEKRLPLLVEGLEAIAGNIARIAGELTACGGKDMVRATRLLRNVGQEEAGKFLILIDSCRAPHSDGRAISRQFQRAGNHLAKLIYAQMADYSITSREEMVDLIEMHRKELHLDGPNDFDFIFRNELISERESTLYVDLVDSEGELEWWAPSEYAVPMGVSRPMILVQALVETGIVSPAGLRLLRDAWSGFNPLADSHYSEWAKRSSSALETFATQHMVDEAWSKAASRVVHLWPMPLVELDISEVEVKVEELVIERAEKYKNFLASEFGFDYSDCYQR
jgi:hypothetical protein